MTESKPSRRDAVKALAAITAGTALSLGQWQKPLVRVGALPAYAQASGVTGLSFDQFCSNVVLGPNPSYTNNFQATIIPATQFVPLNLTLLSNNGVNIIADPSGTYQTNASGVATSNNFTFGGLDGQTITYRWTFANPSNGTGSCDSFVEFINFPA